MYQGYFQFREPPFGVTPDPQIFYASAANGEACAEICKGVAQGGGVFLIVGEPGTGKTTLLRKILSDLGPEIKTAYLPQILIDEPSVLHLVIDDLGLTPSIGDPPDSTERLRDFLVEQSRTGKSVVLVIDEAQNLEAACFEELQEWTALTAANHSLLQVVLAGQPELAAKLDAPHLLGFRKRIAQTHRLQPLSREEVASYIRARLRAAGCRNRDLFDQEALAAIAAFSAGNPRLINLLCDHALLNAYALSETTVRAGMVEEAARDLDIAQPPQDPEEVEAVKSFIPEAHRAGANSSLSAQFDQRELFAVAVDGSARGGRQARRAGGIHRALTAASLIGLLAGAGVFYFRHPSTTTPPVVAQASVNVATSVADSLTEHPGAFDSAAKPENMPITPLPVAVLSQEPPPPKGDMEVLVEKPAAPVRLNRTDQRPRSASASHMVVGPSFVRAKPTSNADIIATLEPGTDIAVTGRSGDYVRIRSIGGAAVTGYVHREDAFFERKK